jgi:predicted nucleotidyltransferase
MSKARSPATLSNAYDRRPVRRPVPPERHNGSQAEHCMLEIGAKRIDEDALAQICRRYSVRELSVFGSTARGDARPGSDIDLMVEFEPSARIGVFRFMTFSGELESLLGEKVDLVTKTGLKPWIRPQALKDARLLYAA